MTMPNAKRINNICRHLVGTRNSMQSAMKPQELAGSEFYDAVIAKIGRNAYTGKWEYKPEGYGDDNIETRIIGAKGIEIIHRV